MRTFVAVELSETIRASIGEMIASLRSTGAPVKWVEPNNLHLTLKFLGNLAEDNLAAAIEIMKQCAEGVGPFELNVSGAGAFPNLRRPRVLFVEARDTPRAAAELARRLDRRMTRAGVRKEDRAFRCHVTIGRIRKPGPVHALAEKLEAMSAESFGTMTVNRIVLMRSELTRAGPIYSPVAKADLSDS